MPSRAGLRPGGRGQSVAGDPPPCDAPKREKCRTSRIAIQRKNFHDGRANRRRKIFGKNTIDLQWKMRANYNARPCAGEGKAAGAGTMENNAKNNAENNRNSRTSGRALPCWTPRPSRRRLCSAEIRLRPPSPCGLRWTGPPSRLGLRRTGSRGPAAAARRRRNRGDAWPRRSWVEPLRETQRPRALSLSGLYGRDPSRNPVCSAKIGPAPRRPPRRPTDRTAA